jgi:hypothetical protein
MTNIWNTYWSIWFGGSDAVLNQLEAFFKIYNKQAGRQFKVTAKLGAVQAVPLLN